MSKVVEIEGRRFARHPRYGIMELSQEQPFGPSFVCGLPLWGRELQRIEALLAEREGDAT